MLHVPKLSSNLLSEHQMTKTRNKLVFDEDGCTVYNKYKDQIMKIKPIDGVYRFRAEDVKCFLTTSKDNALMWHRRLGYINYKELCKMRDGLVDGIRFTNADEKRCEVCMKGKQTTTFPKF